MTFDQTKTIIIPSETNGKPTVALTRELIKSFIEIDKAERIVIPDTVTAIGYGAFSYCRSLISVEIPDSVVSIGAGAFSGCDRLKELKIPRNATSIDSGPFENAFSGAANLERIDVSSDNVAYQSIDGVLYSKDGKTLVAVPNGRQGVFVVPNSVTEIGTNSFLDCKLLTGVAIPNSVTRIGFRAFNNCKNLVDLEIPKSVAYIDWYPFEGCDKLDVKIPASATVAWQDLAAHWD